MKAENADAEEAVDEYYPAYTPTTAIKDVATVQPQELLKTEYFSLDGSKRSLPSKGVSIRKMTFMGDKTIIDKIIK